MTTDSHYAIGKSHMVCQDVARHGDGIIVCDGCSGSSQSELGAQILAQTVSTRANMLAGHISPTVATMHAVHVLTHLTGVDASR